MRPDGAIRGLSGISDGQGVSGIFSCSELRVGSPCMSQLRTDLLALVSKFDYVLAHTWFTRSCKLSSFDGCRVGRYLTSPTVMYTGIVYGTPMDSPVRYHMKDVHQGKVGPNPTLWLLSWTVATHGVFITHVCHVVKFYLARFKLIQISATLSDMSDTCLLQSFRRSATSLWSN
jgi:hypothetical protein